MVPILDMTHGNGLEAVRDAVGDLLVDEEVPAECAGSSGCRSGGSWGEAGRCTSPRSSSPQGMRSCSVAHEHRLERNYSTELKEGE